MHHKLGFIKPLTAAVLLSAPLMAESVLKVEEILAQQNNFKVDFSVSYSNIDQKGGVGSLMTVDTPLGGLLTFLGIIDPVPGYAGEQINDRDIFVYSLNAKYGVTKDLELVAFANAYTSITRLQVNPTDGPTVTAEETEHDFSSAGVGFTYKVKGEDSYPALLLSATTNVVSNAQYAVLNSGGQVVAADKETANFDNFNFVALSYYTVDPVVFVLKGAYQWSVEQTHNEKTYDRADIISITPEIYFAVNPYANLNWGFIYQYKGEESVDGATATNAESVIGLKFGISYEIAHNSILTVEVSKNDTSTYQQSSVNILFSKTF